MTSSHPSVPVNYAKSPLRFHYPHVFSDDTLVLDLNPTIDISELRFSSTPSYTSYTPQLADLDGCHPRVPTTRIIPSSSPSPPPLPFSFSRFSRFDHERLPHFGSLIGLGRCRAVLYYIPTVFKSLAHISTVTGHW